MDRFDLAVKWDDKGVEGITAFADGFEEAEREAYRFANLRSVIFGAQYEVVSCRTLSDAELAQIRADWAVYDKIHAEITAKA